MKTIKLEFDRYWKEEDKGQIPAKSGIYCVYRCTYDKDENKWFFKELLYIGESENVKGRLSDHERLDDWKNLLKANEKLFYSFAAISTDRERAEAALIYEHKPPMNTEYKDNFPYPDTEIILSGKTAMLKKHFIVEN